MARGAHDRVRYRNRHPGHGRVVRPLPAGRAGADEPDQAVGRVTAANGRFVHTRSDRPEITWRLPDGTVERIVRWRAEPTLLTDEHLEPVEAYERVMGRMNYGVSDARLEEIVREGMSLYRARSAGRCRSSGPRSPTTTETCGCPPTGWATRKRVAVHRGLSEGEWLGRGEAPAGCAFSMWRRAGAWGAQDELDVEGVVVYEMQPGHR